MTMVAKSHKKWVLIENNSHRVFEFASEKKLREFAKEHSYTIKRSRLNSYCFYTESYQYVPAT